MPRFAANLTMLFADLPLLERLECAAAAGFTGVEILFPYDEDPTVLRDTLQRLNLELVLFNLPAGDFAAGERGMANDPRRTDEFRAGVAQALTLAGTLGVTQLNCLVGRALRDVPLEQQRDAIVANLLYAAEQAASAGVRILIEPLNTIDTPGFMVSTTMHAEGVLAHVAHENLSIQYDVYHAQRMEGNLVETLTRGIAAGHIRHIQIADSPARNEPGTGEINYPFIFDAIDAAGYEGWVGCEYRPLTTTDAGLGWLAQERERQITRG